MYAVFRTGGKQFRAGPGERLRIPSLAAEAGETVTFGDVLLLADGDAVTVGQPTLAGVAVKAEVVAHGRDRKVIVFKRKRRKGYRKKQGHRQGYTEIRVEEIVA
jgi:large subunit ribosomal protein L21